MTMHTLQISDKKQRQLAHKWVDHAPDGWLLRLEPATSSKLQKAKMWATLGDIAKQARHEGRSFSADDWKILFMHALEHEVRFMTGLSGEPFPVGFRSKHMSSRQMSELIDFIQCWAAQNNITLHDRGFKSEEAKDKGAAEKPDQQEDGPPNSHRFNPVGVNGDSAEFKQGYQEFAMGHDDEDLCPHPINTDEANDWIAGNRKHRSEFQSADETA